MKELQLKLKRMEKENGKLKEADKASSQEGGDLFIKRPNKNSLIFKFMLKVFYVAVFVDINVVDILYLSFFH